VDVADNISQLMGGKEEVPRREVGFYADAPLLSQSFSSSSDMQATPGYNYHWLGVGIGILGI
jgi:hypothetical protein